MKKNYFIKLKNGDSYEINNEQFQLISKALSSNKKDLPQFITIGETFIKTDYIASIKPESW